MYTELLACAGKVLAEQGKTYLSFVDINPATIVFTLINTLIIFLLYRFFLHNKVMDILDKRQQAINADFEAAEAAKKEAEQTKAEYTEKLQQSKEEADQIIAAATKRAADKEAEIIAEANAGAARMKQQAQESIEQEKRRALNEVKDQISEVVVLAASKVCEKEISEKDNAVLIEGFLAGVGKEG